MPRLKIETVPLTELTPHPRNPRHGDVGAITESLTAFGQYAPIVVQKSTGYVLAGNHRLRAAEALGWPDIQVVRVDVDDATAERILVADNRMSDIATNDDPALVELLSELAVDGRLVGTGYDGDDLDALLKLTEEPTFLPDTEAPPRLDQRNPTTCPECGFEWRVGPGNTVEPV